MDVVKNDRVMEKKPVFVTKPFLPPLEEFVPMLEQIWKSRVLTNGGTFHQSLEERLCDYLGVNQVSLFANGTLALVTALQTLRITGEVITTPYSFVATSHALLWNGIKPVFVDIDPKTLNIDVNKIESAITPKTTAILPVHCYGTPCDVEGIQRIADNYNLKVIYDGAHAFGVKSGGESILRHGDLTVLSFHATKVFNTFEGGAIISSDAKTKKRIDQLKNFGFVDEVTVVAPGINGKMSEFNAALGLVQLKHMETVLSARRRVFERYEQAFALIEGIQTVLDPRASELNYSYYPVLIEPGFGKSRDAVYDELKAMGIHTRRYFYPLISEFPMYRGLDSAQVSNLPHAWEVAQKVLCLPIYPDLEDEVVEKITQYFRDGVKS